MASLMEELLGVLEKEETEYLTLIDLADVKSQAIIKADIAKLGEVTEKEQEAASTLLNLSNKRTQVLNDMATVLGKKPEQMTINRMIGYLENQPREQQMLAERRDRLLEACGRRRRPLITIKTPIIQETCLAAVDLTRSSR